MEHRVISEQVLLEHEVLANLTDAIRATIGWKFPGDDGSRKLSSLAFVVHSFQRHFDHLMALEERDGYMDAIERSHSEFCPQVAVFRLEHAELRQAISQVCEDIDKTSAIDHLAIATVCEQTLALLHDVEEHSSRETHLIQAALLCGAVG